MRHVCVALETLKACFCSVLFPCDAGQRERNNLRWSNFFYISLCRSFMSNVSTFFVASLMEKSNKGVPGQHWCIRALWWPHIFQEETVAKEEEVEDATEKVEDKEDNVEEKAEKLETDEKEKVDEKAHQQSLDPQSGWRCPCVGRCWSLWLNCRNVLCQYQRNPWRHSSLGWIFCVAFWCFHSNQEYLNTLCESSHDMGNAVKCRELVTMWLLL